MLRDDGISSNDLSYPMALTVICFISIAIYNTIELTTTIFTTFKRRSGLYFWSILVATLGILPYSLAWIFKFYIKTKYGVIYATLIALGWPAMITGQSLVLYSRLHLIQHAAHKAKWILYMIIIDAIVCHIPTIVLFYGCYASSTPQKFTLAYSIYEKFQITVFFLQECIISGIYLWRTSKLMRDEQSVRGRRSRSVMTHLIWVNVIIIVLDVTLLATEYAGYYEIQTSYKGAVYSIKLKMEFNILNRLLDLFQGRLTTTSSDHFSCSNRRSPGHTLELGDVPKPSSRHLNSKRARHSQLGNTSYACMDDEYPPMPPLTDMEVIKTTEIKVESTPTREMDDDDDDDDAIVHKMSVQSLSSSTEIAESIDVAEVRRVSQNSSDEILPYNKSRDWEK